MIILGSGRPLHLYHLHRCADTNLRRRYNRFYLKYELNSLPYSSGYWPKRKQVFSLSGARGIQILKLCLDLSANFDKKDNTEIIVVLGTMRMLNTTYRLRLYKVVMDGYLVFKIMCDIARTRKSNDAPLLKDKFISKKTISPISFYAFLWFKNLAINIKHLLKNLKMPKNNVFLQDILTTLWFLLTGPGPNIICK